MSITDFYDIYTPMDLFNIWADPYGTYTLKNDIDMTGFEVPEDGPSWFLKEYWIGKPWAPITYFYGTLDGQGYTIHNLHVEDDMVIGREAGQTRVGLFQFLRQGSSVKNLHFKNAAIMGFDYTGVIAGVSYGNINSCTVEGIIKYTTAQTPLWGRELGYFGGVAGLCEGGNITQCASYVKISESRVGGGVAGVLLSTIENCYHIGEVYGDEARGGMVGWNIGSIKNSYHAGNCRVVGESMGGSVINCYYDFDQSQLAEQPGLGVARSTTDMTWPGDFDTTFIGWSFPDVWKLAPNVNSGYPQFSKHVVARLLGGAISGTSLLVGKPGIKGLLMIAGTISAESDWQALVTRFFALRGRIDAVSWWQAYKALMEIWAKREGKYERVTPYVKVGGAYLPVTQVLRKSDDEWRL